jgi:hypothetical protein
MVPAFTLTIDIEANESITSEKEFRERLFQSVVWLDALSGSFGKKPCSVSFYPPNPENENSEPWCARCVLLISVGRERGENLLELYDAMVNLIMFELPEFEVRAETAKLNFS